MVWGSRAGYQIVSYREVGSSDEQDLHIDWQAFHLHLGQSRSMQPRRLDGLGPRAGKREPRKRE